MSSPYSKLPSYSRFNEKQNDHEMGNSQYIYGSQSVAGFNNQNQKDLKQSISTNPYTQKRNE